MPDLVLDAHRRLIPIDHPDLSVTTAKLADGSVTRAKLEYPTVNVTLAYLASINKATVLSPEGIHGLFLCTLDDFADRAFQAVLSVGGSAGSDDFHKVCVGGRVSGHKTRNSYLAGIATTRTASDFGVVKYVAGSATILGTEAVDIGVGTEYTLRISISGTTIRGFRSDMATPKITVTDTSLTSGKFGGSATPSFDSEPQTGSILLGLLLSPSSPSPQSIAYFEVPVIGSGTPDDPFRPQLPEEIAWNWDLNPRAKRKYDILKARGFNDEEIFELFPEVLSCRTNRLALTHSALIVSDTATGKPREYTAIVRVFDQPDRQPHLHPIGRCIGELQRMKGVRRLSRDEAIKRAKQLDDKLTDIDLLPVDKSDKQFKQKLKDYKAHRVSLGVREELIDEKIMEQYLAEDKGW